VLALLPVAAAVSPDAVPPAQVPVAIAQPIASMPLMSARASGRLLSEPGLLVLVGTGLMGLAAIVRRSTRT
jgi:hypothetical protein